MTLKKRDGIPTPTPHTQRKPHNFYPHPACASPSPLKGEGILVVSTPNCHAELVSASHIFCKFKQADKSGNQVQVTKRKGVLRHPFFQYERSLERLPSDNLCCRYLGSRKICLVQGDFVVAFGYSDSVIILTDRVAVVSEIFDYFLCPAVEKG